MSNGQHVVPHESVRRHQRQFRRKPRGRGHGGDKTRPRVKVRIITNKDQRWFTAKRGKVTIEQVGNESLIFQTRSEVNVFVGVFGRCSGVDDIGDLGEGPKSC